MSSSDWIIIPTRKGNIKNVPNHQPVGIWFSAYLCINLGIRSIQRWFDDQTQKKHDSSDPSALTLWVNTGMGYQRIPAVAFWKIHRNPHGNKTLTGQSGLRHSVALAIDPFSSRFNGFPGKMIYEFAGFSNVFHMSFMLLERETCSPDCQQDSWNTVKQGCDLLVSSGWWRFFLTWERTTNHCSKEKIELFCGLKKGNKIHKVAATQNGYIHHQNN